MTKAPDQTGRTRWGSLPRAKLEELAQRNAQGIAAESPQTSQELRD